MKHKLLLMLLSAIGSLYSTPSSAQNTWPVNPPNANNPFYVAAPSVTPANSVSTRVALTGTTQTITLGQICYTVTVILDSGAANTNVSVNGAAAASTNAQLTGGQGYTWESIPVSTVTLNSASATGYVNIIAH